MNSIVISNATTVDCAWFHKGLPKGLSFTPSFLVSGTLTSDEQVVMDFGTCKRRIKEIIDHPFNGWDHKLLWNPNVVDFSTVLRRTRQVDTAHVKLSVPEDAMKQVGYRRDGADLMEVLLFDMSRAISKELGLNVQAFWTGDYTAEDTEFVTSFSALCAGKLLHTRYSAFTYTHGLAKSSSWGCQNILHGHTSFVCTATDMTKAQAPDEQLVSDIKKYLDESYIVSEEHFDSRFQTVTYNSVSRGHMSLTLKDTNVVVLTAEPTIENIITHVVDKFRDRLTASHVRKLGISEGRWKGAVVSL